MNNWQQFAGLLQHQEAEVILKGVLLLAVVALVVRCLQRSSAAVKHLLWCLGLAGVLFIGFFESVLPKWPVEMQWLHFPATELLSPIAADESASQTPTQKSAVSEAFNFTHGSVSHAVESKKITISPGTWLLAIWLAGFIAAMAPVSTGIIHLWLITRKAKRLENSDWLEVMEAAQIELDTWRKIKLLETDRLNVAVTWGFWPAVILLPTGSAEWPEEKRRMVVLHELAHVKRWDWLTQTVAAIACAVHWFNPLAWLAARRMRIERELACDDLVLGTGMNATDYAEELLRFAAKLGRTPLAARAAVPMARSSSLEGRLLALLDNRRNRGAISPALLTLTVACFTGVILSMTMLEAADKRPTATKNGWGPVVERVLFDNDSLNTEASMLDLDSGKFLVPKTKEIQGLAGLEAIIKEIRAEGIDLMGDASGRTFHALDAVVIEVDDQFEAVSADEVVADARLNEPLEERLVKPKQTLPATYIFRTKQGGRGLLEVQKFESNPDRMAMRYKLVGSAFPGGRRERRETGNQPAKAAEEYKFDRIYEYVIKTNQFGILDLDSGKIEPEDILGGEQMLVQSKGKELIAVSVPLDKWNGSANDAVAKLSEATGNKGVEVNYKEKQAWHVRTSEGKAGVLLAQPHPRKSDSVIIRYKTVRRVREFTPNRLTIFQWSEPAKYLDLDSGKLVSEKPENSLTASFEKLDDEWYLKIEGMHNYYDQRKNAWDTMSAEQIGEPAGLAGVPFERTGFYRLSAGELPTTVLIPAWGLVRIEGVDDRTSSAILQFKRVIERQKIW